MTHRQTATSVPKWSSIRPGASVSIVLKQDQPTGRQVQGIVQDLLTRHDHPRGVKVRLADGRVGRVQQLISTGSEQASQTATIIQKPKYRDIRLDEPENEPDQAADLMAYVKPAKQKKKKGQPAGEPDEAATSTSQISCPVCQDFTGDEAAVSHHVTSHFD